MNEKMIVMIALVAKEGCAQASVAIPTRIKVLTRMVHRWRSLREVTPNTVFFLLHKSGGFSQCSVGFNDLMLAMRTSEAAGYHYPLSAADFSRFHKAALVCKAKPEVYATGKEVGAALLADRIEAIENEMNWSKA